MFSVLPTLNVMQCHHYNDVMCERVRRHLVQNIVTLKIVYNEKKIYFFGMNMPFISSRESRKCILPLMIYAFSLHSIK